MEHPPTSENEAKKTMQLHSTSDSRQRKAGIRHSFRFPHSALCIMPSAFRIAAAAAFAANALVSVAAPERRASLRVACFTGYSTLENYPALIRISPARISGFSYTDCAAGGADLSFTLPDGTLLPHEVDTWNPDGESLVWVLIPAFARNTQFFVRWKDPVPPANDPSAVWSRRAL